MQDMILSASKKFFGVEKSFRRRQLSKNVLDADSFLKIFSMPKKFFDAKKFFRRRQLSESLLMQVTFIDVDEGHV